jgi:hypothetical protein
VISHTYEKTMYGGTLDISFLLGQVLYGLAVNSGMTWRGPGVDDVDQDMGDW